MFLTFNVNLESSFYPRFIIIYCLNLPEQEKKYLQHIQEQEVTRFLTACWRVALADRAVNLISMHIAVFFGHNHWSIKALNDMAKLNNQP